MSEGAAEAAPQQTVSVCRGLACDEAFSLDVLRDWEKALGIHDGESSPDGSIRLCSQNCFGRCAVGPNIKISNEHYSGQRPGMAKLHIESIKANRQI